MQRAACPPAPSRGWRLVVGLLLLGLGACEAAQPPPTYEVVELRGSPYQRGLQHGQRFSSKIRSFYTQMLTTSLLPYLNRERPDIASVLLTYQNPIYDGGDFSYQLLLRSGINLEADIPEPYLEEMRGIADGAGVDYKMVLILNTFLDTMVGIRSITFFIRKTQAPDLQSLSFGDLSGDGRDNDGDGVVDEEDEGTLAPFSPSPTASMVGVPADSTIEFKLWDSNGVNADGLRILLNQDLYLADDPALTSEVSGASGAWLTVRFRLPGGLAPATTYTIQLSAGDNSWVDDPPPARARQMRDQRFVFTTAGDPRPPHAVENRGYDDGRSQPPAISFAARGSATRDGQPLLAHHFALLDSNTSHKHAVVWVIHPDEGLPHVVLGLTGVVFGFSGINSAGVSYAANLSDTLDNPLVDGFRRNLIFAELLASGTPVGIVGRELLSRAHSAAEARDVVASYPPTFGWNMMLADRDGDLRGLEIDGAILDDSVDIGLYEYGPDPTDPANLDAHGRPLASIGPDDLRMASHFRKNTEDIELALFGMQVQQQRTWSSFYYRSLRSYYHLGDLLGAQLGRLDADAAAAILGTRVLVDQRDSMNAAVYEPAAMRMRFAMGQVPATDGPFVDLDLAAAFAGELP